MKVNLEGREYLCGLDLLGIGNRIVVDFVNTLMNFQVKKC